MKILFSFIMIFYSVAISQEFDDFSNKRILHVSAHPANTEIYVSEIGESNARPSFSKKAEYVSPAAIPVDYEASTVRITMFKPGFRDSTIDVSIPRLDESYLMVILQQETREEVLEKQERAIAKRSQRVVGNWMMLGSILPYGLAIASTVFNQKSNDNANDIKEKLSTHKIESEKTQQLKSDFKEERRSAGNYKKMALWSAGIGTAIFGIGLYLRF